jgi:hypothetical protein
MDCVATTRPDEVQAANDCLCDGTLVASRLGMPSCRVRVVWTVAIACGSAGLLSAQSPAPDYFRQSLSGAFVYGVKAGPNGGVSYPFLNDKPGYGIDYSFRPRRWLALEAGFEQIVRPVGSSVCCEFASNAQDELFLVPFGARYVWEPGTSRLRLTAGGGGAYLNHVIGDPAGGAVGFSGWGGQFVVSGEYAVTRSGRLRLGLTGRYYFASPRPSVNLYPPFPLPNDTLHLFVIGPQVTWSFR